MRIYLIILFVLLAAASVHARAGLGIDLGIWKPSSLDSYSSQPLKNVDGASPYLGGSVYLPFYQSHTLRASLMQWQQREPEQTDVSMVTLRQLALDLKYILLPQYTISPYACYGASAIWSRELPKGGDGATVPLDRAGWGFGVGAGIDFMLQQRWALGVEYQYLYAQFAKRVGATDNYSGPRFSIHLLILF